MSKEQMKNIPKENYLQVGGDGDAPEDFKELTEVSWCQDKINDDDIKYVLSTPPQSVRTATAEEIENKIEEILDGRMQSEWTFNCDHVQAGKCLHYCNGHCEEYKKLKSDLVAVASQFKPTPIANEEELREKYFKEVRTGTGEAFNWFLSHAHELKHTTIQETAPECSCDKDHVCGLCHKRKGYKVENGKLIQESKEVAVSYWRCNECNSQEYSASISKDDINQLSCSSCGCDEFHKQW